MLHTEKRRRSIVVSILLVAVFAGLISNEVRTPPAETPADSQAAKSILAAEALKTLQVKGRAPRTGYSRAQFGYGWQQTGGCDMRNSILRRDLSNPTVRSETDCTVVNGTLRNDPYTGKMIGFVRGEATSGAVQIDHVVAVSDAWQKGAQQLPHATRIEFYNDPLNLLAVDGPANARKGDGDAATWLPPNKPFRCRYIARQIAVKAKYQLWITKAEQIAMRRVLHTCPGQVLPLVVPA
jgi:hypothetical protein